MGLCDLDNLIPGQVRSHRRVLAPLANHVGFIGFLPVHAKPILITENCDCLQGKFVRCSKDSNRDFSSIGHYRRYRMLAITSWAGPPLNVVERRAPRILLSSMTVELARILWWTK